MGPKVQAACEFVQQTGAFAAIGAISEVEGLLHGGVGTRVEQRDPTSTASTEVAP